MRTLLLLSFLTSSVAYSATDLGCKNTYLASEYDEHFVSLSTLDHSWHGVAQDNLEHIQATQLPLQHDDKKTPFHKRYQLSCGPISIAISYIALGHQFHTRTLEQWDAYIFDFRHFIGGVFPTDLIHDANRLKQANEPVITHRQFHTFVNTFATIKSELDQRRPVIALLVPCAYKQHYVTIVAYHNDGRVAIMDTTGKLFTAPLGWLERLMFADVTDDEGDAYFKMSQESIAMFRTHTEFSRFNIFTFQDVI